MFTMKIDTRNAAFDDDNRGLELARILRKVAAQVEDGIAKDDHGLIMDINGNRVGIWKANRR